MKRSGASLAVFALEQIGVKATFGIPGVHNTELYDELNNSKSIQPYLVTHECGAAFMADAVSRTSDSIGTIVIVPAAGMTHALSGIGEAYLDGIPMLILSGGVRTDSGRSYQLHQIDQLKIMEGITKKAFRIQDHKEIIPTIYEAYRIATTEECGPTFVEIPVNIQLFQGEVDSLPLYHRNETQRTIPMERISEAVQLLKSAKHPGLFVGWGAKNATQELIEISEILNAPVATTLQGLSVFPASHRNHTGMGFGEYSVPAGEAAFDSCDCLIAIGTRFSEIPTGSFGMKVPENLIHIDVNPNVFSKNYPAKVSILGDAKEVLVALLDALRRNDIVLKEDSNRLEALILKKKREYQNEWYRHIVKDRVNPALFFKGLRENMNDDSILVVDDGNHTFLAAELFPVNQTKTFISPTDFNCMGYCVPASIGAKLMNPEKTVVGIVGDGAFLMTGLELITASSQNLGVIIFVFYDGELSQISQGQQIPYGRKTCTVLGEMNLKGIATGTGAAYLHLTSNEEIVSVVQESIRISKTGQPVVIEVKVDYSKATRFTKGVVKTNLGRFPLGEKFRFIGRALLRKIIG